MTSKVLEKLKILVDKKVETLSKKPNFRKDHIGGKYAWSTSVISSAYKRHGAILEEAITIIILGLKYKLSHWFKSK